MNSAPSVTAIIISYQYGRFLAAAIESVLGQDYPADRLEVLVIDDGSTDCTAQIVEPYLDRVRYVYKDNGGLLSAVNRGISEASGELLALQSADDVWTPGRLRRQVEALTANPQVGLVYGDLTVVDGDLNLVAPSYWAMTGIVPQRGSVLSALVRGNFVSGGTTLFRASLRDSFYPLPAHAGWEDWWIAVRIAEVAELEYLTEPLLLYRQHGQNTNLGADAARQQANAAHEAPFRRWLLTDLNLAEVEPADVLAACRSYEYCVMAAAALASTQSSTLVKADADASQRSRAAALASRQLLTEGDLPGAARAAARAIGNDLCNPLAGDLLDAIQMMLASGRAPAPLPAADDQAPPLRGFVTLALAQELIDTPALLAAYGSTFGAGDDATLLIALPHDGTDEATQQIVAAVAAGGLDGECGPDLVASVIGGGARGALTAAAASALLSAYEHDGELANLPRVDAASVARLHTLMLGGGRA